MNPKFHVKPGPDHTVKVRAYTRRPAPRPVNPKQAALHAELANECLDRACQSAVEHGLRCDAEFQRLTVVAHDLLAMVENAHRP